MEMRKEEIGERQHQQAECAVEQQHRRQPLFPTGAAGGDHANDRRSQPELCQQPEYPGGDHRRGQLPFSTWPQQTRAQDADGHTHQQHPPLTGKRQAECRCQRARVAWSVGV
jgi:hypothetical protein